MPITTYASGTIEELNERYPNADSIKAYAVNHKRGCKCSTARDGWPDTSRQTLSDECDGCCIGYMVTRFTGRVISERESNRYHDSDFFATVLVDGKLQEIAWGTTRAWTYFNGCKVDATEETLAAYKVICEQARQAAEKAALEAEAKRLAIRETMPAKGDRVTVVSKRSKVPHGTEGTVVWFGLGKYSDPLYRGGFYQETEEDRWDKGRRSDFRVGFRTDTGETHWCAASCVETTQDVVT